MKRLDFWIGFWDRSLLSGKPRYALAASDALAQVERKIGRIRLSRISHAYDGDGDRVEKSNGKMYWYGAGTEILDESDLSGNLTT
ncbi:MAG: hypothetical protein ACRD40_17800, partial [Candidatus Acidiferrales bacterium]